MGNCTALGNRLPPFPARACQKYPKDNHHKEQGNTKPSLNRSYVLEEKISNRTQAHGSQ